MKKFISVIYGGFFPLFFFDLPIYFTTSNRIGLVLTLFFSFLLFIEKKKFKIEKNLFNYFVFILILSLFSFISFSLSDYSEFSEFSSVVTSFFLAINILLFTYILTNLEEVYKYKLFISFYYSFYLIVIAFLFYLFYSFGFDLIAISSEVRNWMDQIGPGLNRLINGFVASLSLCFIVIFSYQKDRMLSVFVLSLLVFSICVISGSRQGMICVLIILLLGAIQLINLNPYSFFKRVFFKSAIIVTGIFVGIKLYDIIYQRLFLETVNQVKMGTGSIEYRMTILNRVLDLFKKNWLIGIGPGSLKPLTNMSAHNGYAGILVETGIIGFSVFLGSLIFFFKKTLVSQLNRLQLSNLLVLSVVTIAGLHLQVVFNDLIKTNLFWIGSTSILFLVLNVNKS